MTRRFALLGHPVSHSLSPALHAAAYQQLGLDARYELWDVSPEDLPSALARAKRELDGFNVTVPHKAAVFASASDIHEVGQQVGAINTVKVQGDRLRGRNTDVFGVQRACSDEGFVIEGGETLVLGSGGAARACVVAAARGRATRVTVAARDLAKAKRLANEMHALFGKQCPIEACALGDAAVFARASLVLQATSATLASADPDAAHTDAAQAFADALALDALPDHAAVMDLVYKPLETTVMQAARARGLKVAGGLGMLLHQGAAAFEWWTGELAPIDVMRSQLYAAARL